jgi:putative zinc finger protein
MASVELPGLECDEVRRLLPSFLANEVPTGTSAGVQEHLSRCEACRRFRGFEEGFDRLLARGLTREPVDASLQARILQGLQTEDAAAGSRVQGASGAAWGRWATLAALLATVFLAFGIVWQRGILSPAPANPPAAAPSEAIPVEQVMTGRLVCDACERGGTPVSGQRGCRAFGHHSALKSDKSVVWEFIETDLTRPLLTDADRIGQRLEVRGVFFPELHYVRVSQYRYLGSGGEGPSGL